VPFMGVIRLGMGAGIGQMLLQYGLALGMTFVLALIIDALAPKFGGEKSSIQAMKTAAYSYTAGWVAGVFLIVPWIGWLLAIAGSLYGVYLLYLALPHTMKAPLERTVAYTAVVVLIAIVLGWVGGAVVGALSGAGSMLATGSPIGGHSLRVDEDSGLGKLAAFGAKMEEANKKMEAAQKAGDADAPAAAAAAVLGTALGGGASVEALAPGALKAFVPDRLGGLPRTDFSAERNGAMGMQISTARASYSDGQGRRLRLEITDAGGARGLMGLAALASVEQESESDTGYEKTYKADGRLVHEQWDGAAKRGEYSVVLGDRFTVKVEGDAGNIDVLKGAVGSLDLRGLEALKNEGVTQD